ncbi:TFIIB-like protein [Lysobacter ruishenii]|uniref:TFIIB-like protein n=2 Tax=Aerolutibacter ruishenii TaxID=686800 RepID=A0A562M2X1_9GAMM|nr:TFIIB-like protein [Lysobacter ruishenii]
MMSAVLSCPKCGSPMERVVRLAGHADRCTRCGGLWFEMMEHEHLKDAAAAIDTGDAQVGQEYNRIDRISCPSCPASPLIRMVDPQQPHIWFESCKRCYGRFYDAGEFRDFAEHTFAEFFRDLDAPARE